MRSCMRSLAWVSTFGVAAFFTAGVASAQPYPHAPPPQPYYPQPYPYAPPPGYAPPAYAPPPAAPVVVPRDGGAPDVQRTPNGGVAVTSTPDGPVDVHAQTADGHVHAYGCSRVQVDPPAPGAAAPPVPAPPPCPYAAPYPYPYLVHAPPPYAYYGPRPRLFYPPQRPKYEPDPARTTSIVLSTVLFGLGTMVGGTATLVDAIGSDSCGELGRGACGGGHRVTDRAGYWVMGASVVIPAGVPRMVMGDWGIEMLLGGLRAGSFAAGTALIGHTGDASGPVMLSLAVPVAISIADLVTVPHREQMMRRRAEADAKKSFHLDGIAPTVTADASGALVPAVGALGRF